MLTNRRQWLSRVAVKWIWRYAALRIMLSAEPVGEWASDWIRAVELRLREVQLLLMTTWRMPAEASQF